MNPIFYGYVGKDQRLHLKPPYDERWNTHLSGMKHGTELQVIVRKATKKNLRTDLQNRYYFGVVVKSLAAHLGYEPSELHEALKAKFLMKKIDNNLSVVGTTSNLSIAEFSEYVDDVRRFAATQLDFYIPDPGDVDLDSADYSFSE